MGEANQAQVDKLLLEASLAAEQRHYMGETKYGPNTFLTIDTVQHAIDEVLDLMNYARYTYVKLRLFQAGLLEGIQADGSVATGKPKTDKEYGIWMAGEGDK